jgi:hypothetical protein
MTPAHTLVAQACLGILLHLDKDVVTGDSLENGLSPNMLRGTGLTMSSSRMYREMWSTG